MNRLFVITFMLLMLPSPVGAQPKGLEHLGEAMMALGLLGVGSIFAVLYLGVCSSHDPGEKNAKLLKVLAWGLICSFVAFHLYYLDKSVPRDHELLSFYKERLQGDRLSLALLVQWIAIIVICTRILRKLFRKK
ncbi:MAG: hypothetical protein KF744_07645 [Taibaiella sp.]|nr:hypothetical protein [Taibaiella sp.]